MSPDWQIRWADFKEDWVPAIVGLAFPLSFTASAIYFSPSIYSDIIWGLIALISCLGLPLLMWVNKK